MTNNENTATLITPFGSCDIKATGDIYVDYNDLKIAITQDGRIYNESARADGKRIRYIEEEY